MKTRILQKETAGFTMIELLAVLAIVGVTTASALPAYHDYISASETTKASHAYDIAVQTVRREFSKNTSRMALGLTSTLPLDEEGWINLFNGNRSATAADGGPAYRPGDAPNHEDPPTGAVYVRVHGDHLHLTRNEFNELDTLETKVYADDTDG